MNMETIKEHTKGYGSPMINPGVIAKEMRYIKDETKELFVVLYLDNVLKVIAREIVNIGVLNKAVIDTRTVFRNAILRNCFSIVIVHNHPSGDVTPSKEDKAITKRLNEAGKIIGIEILDHVIIGIGYYSIKSKKRYPESSENE